MVGRVRDPRCAVIAGRQYENADRDSVVGAIIRAAPAAQLLCRASRTVASLVPGRDHGGGAVDVDDTGLQAENGAEQVLGEDFLG